MPETLESLRKQRGRWYRGLRESLRYHRAMLWRRKFGRIGWFALPAFWLFEYLGPLVEVAGYALVLFLFVMEQLLGHQLHQLRLPLGLPAGLAGLRRAGQRASRSWSGAWRFRLGLADRLQRGLLPFSRRRDVLILLALRRARELRLPPAHALLAAARTVGRVARQDRVGEVRPGRVPRRGGAGAWLSRCQRPRILLVDDDPTIARLVLHVVRSRGFGPAAARDHGPRSARVRSTASISSCSTTSSPTPAGSTSSRPSAPAQPARRRADHGARQRVAGRRRAPARRRRLSGQGPVAARDAAPVLERVRRNRELRKALAAAERDLVRAERLAAIGEMTVTLHHEINNPLMSASADVELLLADPDMPADAAAAGAGGDPGSRCAAFATSSARSATCGTSGPRPTCPGIQMVDLEAAGAGAAGGHRGTALVLVPEEDLARVVSLLLRHAGLRGRALRHDVDRARQAAGPRLGVSLVLVLGGADAAGAHPLGGFDPPAERGAIGWWRWSRASGAAGAGGRGRPWFELPFDPGSFTADMVTVTWQAARAVSDRVLSLLSRSRRYPIPWSRMIRWRIGRMRGERRRPGSPRARRSSPGAGSTMQSGRRPG